LDAPNRAKSATVWDRDFKTSRMVLAVKSTTPTLKAMKSHIPNRSVLAKAFSKSAAQLSEQLFAWNWIGFGIALLGGFLLFSGIATTLLVNAAFQVKLVYLVPIALVWHIIVQRKARTWGQTEQAPALAKLAGLVELLLWLSVVTAAVLIPTY